MADGDESASSEAVNANLGVPARNDNSRADDAREGVEQRQNEGRVQHPNTQSSSIPPSVALNIPDSSGLEDSTQYPRAHSSTPSGQPGATTGNARSSSGVVDSVQQGSSISSDGASPVTAAAGVPSNDRIRARVAANPSLSSYPSATGNATTAPRTAPVMGTGDDEGSSTSSQASPDVTASRPRVGGGLVPVGDRDFDENTTENELELSVPSHQEHLTSDGQRYVQECDAGPFELLLLGRTMSRMFKLRVFSTRLSFEEVRDICTVDTVWYIDYRRWYIHTWVECRACIVPRAPLVHSLE